MSLPLVGNVFPVDCALSDARPNIPEGWIWRFGLLFLWQVPDLDKYWCGSGPAEQDRSPRRKAGKLTQERPQPIRHKTLHLVLIAIIDEPMEQERVALRENGR